MRNDLECPPETVNCEKKAVNESAASAASLDYVEFQAVIKSAASAASRKRKSREGSSRGVPRGRRPPAEPPSCTPLELPSLDLGFLEAALAAFTAPFSQYLAALAANYIKKI